MEGFIAYLAPCSTLYQLNLLNSYYSLFNAKAIVNNPVPGNRLILCKAYILLIARWKLAI